MGITQKELANSIHVPYQRINEMSLLQNDDFRSTSRHVKNFYRRHIIDIPRIKI